MQLGWRDNDALFRRECEAGHFWESQVYRFLLAQGLDVKIAEQSIRDDVRRKHRWIASYDLLVEGYPVEVKSRRLAFHTPSDVPYGTLMVMTESSWNERSPKPTAVICVSRLTGAMIYVSASTRRDWIVKRKRDRVRNHTDNFLEAPRRLWLPIEVFVKRAQGVRVCRE